MMRCQGGQGGDDTAPRGEEPATNVTNRIEMRVNGANGANGARNIHEAGSPRGEHD